MVKCDVELFEQIFHRLQVDKLGVGLQSDEAMESIQGYVVHFFELLGPVHADEGDLHSLQNVADELDVHVESLRATLNQLIECLSGLHLQVLRYENEVGFPQEIVDFALTLFVEILVELLEVIEEVEYRLVLPFQILVFPQNIVGQCLSFCQILRVDAHPVRTLDEKVHDVVEGKSFIIDELH